jgi:hypothetical protein
MLYKALRIVSVWIALTFYSRRGKQSIAEVSPKRPRFNKITSLQGIQTADMTGGKSAIALSDRLFQA